MFTIGLGVIILGLMAWVVYEYKKHSELKRKSRLELEAELKHTQLDLKDIDLEENIVDAKTILKKRRKEIDVKEDKLNKK